MTADRKTEVRCTDWVPFDSPLFDAYRIIVRASSWGWEQRHEWRRKEGAGIRKDGWIRSLAGWPSNVKPMGADGEPLASTPYPFCRTPAECAGKGYCPKEIACND